MSFEVGRVKGDGYIIINADGSIDPPTVSIVTADNVTYTFTGDVNGSIVIYRSNIIIDGGGYRLQPSTIPSYSGFSLSDVSNVTIKNTNIKGFGAFGVDLGYSSNNTISENDIVASSYEGVFLIDASNNRILGNNITANDGIGIILLSSNKNSVGMNNVTNSERGIYLWSSSGNMLRDNAMAENQYNFDVSGNNLSDFLNDVDASNTMDGKPIYYWINEQNATLPLDAGFVALVNCTNIVAQGLALTNNELGILLAFTTDSTITENNITNNFHYGIRFCKSSKINVSKNNILRSNVAVCPIVLQTILFQRTL